MPVSILKMPAILLSLNEEAYGLFDCFAKFF